MTDDARKLLPCPFCGGEPFTYEIEPHKHTIATFMPDHPGSWVVECAACDIHIIRTQRVDAIAAWNRRHAQPAASAVMVPREIDRARHRAVLDVWNNGLIECETLETMWPKLVDAMLAAADHVAPQVPAQPATGAPSQEPHPEPAGAAPGAMPEEPSMPSAERDIILKAQAILAEYIVPDSGISDHECINQLLGLLDGPECREALTTPNDYSRLLLHVKHFDALKSKLSAAYAEIERLKHD